MQHLELRQEAAVTVPRCQLRLVQPCRRREALRGIIARWRGTSAVAGHWQQALQTFKWHAACLSPSALGTVRAALASTAWGAGRGRRALTCARGTRATRAAKVGDAVRRTAGSGSLMRAISGTSSSCVYAASEPARQVLVMTPANLT